MRILYGAFAQGQGHFSKAAVLVPLLEERGHEVRLISSGGTEPPKGYHFNWHRHFPGLSYAVADGRINYKKTFFKWLKEVPDVCRHLGNIRGLVREYQPELVISDFEPLSASPFMDPGCEVIALSRQVTLFDRAIPLPAGMSWERNMTRSIIRLFAAGADRLFGYHYEPLTFRCVPPIIRPELREVTPEVGDHILVYNHYHTVDDGSPNVLCEWAQKNQQRVLAYGFPEVPRGQQGFVEFRPPSRAGMLDDMRTSKAVITSAGLTTAVEAFLLQKPVCTVPIPGQWEQLVNAFHLEQAGIASQSKTWDFDHLLSLAPPSSDNPQQAWLRTPVDQILDRVLNVNSQPKADVAA